MIIIIVVFLAITVLAIAITISMHYVITSKKTEDEKVMYIKQMNEILGLCKIESGEENISDKIDTIIDSLRYGDVNSPKVAKNVEYRIVDKASELLDNLRNKKNVDANNNIDELLKLIKEREVISRNNK